MYALSSSGTDGKFIYSVIIVYIIYYLQVQWIVKIPLSNTKMGLMWLPILENQLLMQNLLSMLVEGNFNFFYKNYSRFSVNAFVRTFSRKMDNDPLHPYHRFSPFYRMKAEYIFSGKVYADII